MLPPLLDRSFRVLEDQQRYLNALDFVCKHRIAAMIPLQRMMRANFEIRSPLFRQARGFATVKIRQANNVTTKLTGGSDGYLFVVRRLADDGPNTLRCAIQKRPEVLRDPDRYPEWMRNCARLAEKPLHIVFQTSGILELSTPLSVASNKTIDGRGSVIQIRGGPIKIENEDNIVMTNLIFDTKRSDKEKGTVPPKAVEIAGSSRHIWIHKSDFLSHGGPQIHIHNLSDRNPAESPTTVSISNSRFFEAATAVKIGNLEAPDPKDKSIFVTLWQNRFEKTTAGSVSVSNGRAHLYRNLFSGVSEAAVLNGNDAGVFAEFNGFLIEKTVPSLVREPAGAQSPGHFELRKNLLKLDGEFKALSLDQAASRPVFAPDKFYLYGSSSNDSQIGFQYEPNPLLGIKSGTPIERRFDQFRL